MVCVCVCVCVVVVLYIGYNTRRLVENSLEKKM